MVDRLRRRRRADRQVRQGDRAAAVDKWPLQPAIHTLASSLSGLSKVRLPDICADVRAWTASGFETVPPDALELDRQVEPLQLPEIPWNAVARDARGSDASVVKYIEQAETKLAEAEFVLGQKDWYQVLETVGLAP